MLKRLSVIITIGLVILPLAVFGCKPRTASTPDEMKTEAFEPSVTSEESQVVQVTEPAQMVAAETIPPTAASGGIEKTVSAAVEAGMNRNREIQVALRNGGFYSGAIDGKIGPVTKKAIMDFQRSKGLVVDGKVGPKTWTELEKYLSQ